MENDLGTGILTIIVMIVFAVAAAYMDAREDEENKDKEGK